MKELLKENWKIIYGIFFTLMTLLLSICLIMNVMMTTDLVEQVQDNRITIKELVEETNSYKWEANNWKEQYINLEVYCIQNWPEE